MSKQTADLIQLRAPTLEDGKKVFQLIRRCPPLDCNSEYAYHLWCRDFAQTSVVAECGGEIVGFISGYRRPSAQHCLFVWQVAVDRKMRNQGLAGRLLDWLVEQPGCDGVQRIETTVSPSNTASRSMFRSFAMRHKYVCYGTHFLSADDFCESKHEPEDLIIIEPRKDRA